MFGRRAREKAAKKAEVEAQEEERRKALERLRPYAADIAQPHPPQRSSGETPRPTGAQDGRTG